MANFVAQLESKEQRRQKMADFGSRGREGAIKAIKRDIRPLLERWYKQMQSEDKDFEKPEKNEISRIVRRAATDIYLGRVRD